MTRIIGLVMGLTACLATGPVGSIAAAAAVHRIVIAKMAFGRSPSDIQPGDTIEWVNEDIFLHSVTAADKSFDVDIAPNASARVVVRGTGRIRYTCKYHPGMHGQLIVTDDRSAAAPSGR